MIKLLEDSGNAWDETRLLQEVAVYSEKRIIQKNLPGLRVI